MLLFQIFILLSQQEKVTAMLEILTATLYENCRGKKWDFLLAVLIISHTLLIGVGW